MSRNVFRALAVTAALGAVGVATATPALASPAALPPGAVKVQFDANGTSQVATIDSTVTLGPATLVTNLFADGTFAGKLHLPPVRVASSKLGPGHDNLIASTLTFIPAAPVTGRLLDKKVTASSSYYLRLTNLTVGGTKADIGYNCKTVAPVVIDLATPKGGVFDINKGGGVVTGTYTIGAFGNCKGFDDILTTVAAGGGNTATVTLSNGSIIG